MTRRPRHPRRSAFAAVTAIVLMGLVASTLAAMGMMFAADARRSRAAAAEAQLRQLLIAGAADVQQRLAGGETRFDLTLALAAEGELRLNATSAEPDRVNASVAAAVGGRRSEQTLRFVRDGRQWTLASADWSAHATGAATRPSDE